MNEPILLDVEVGKYYMVWCYFDLEIYEFVPVLPFAHSDPQFGTAAGNVEHYHIDARFCDDVTISFRYDVYGNRCSRVLRLDEIDKLHYVLMECLSTFTGHAKAPMSKTSNPKANEWYQKQLGKSCAGKLCPHYKTPMLENSDGFLECPMHSLIADKNTLKVVGNIHQGVLVK